MGQFKVGDRVVRTKVLKQSPPMWPNFEEGKVYTVSKADIGWIDLSEMHRDIGFCPYNASFFRLANYSEYFTEPVKAEPTTGHAAGSPIQKHSKGEFYPLCVVGYSDAGRMAYTIENLEQGTVLSFMPGEFKGVSNIRAWSNAASAYKFLAERASGFAQSEWIKGRPTFIEHGYDLEIAMSPKHERWLVKLGKFELADDVMLINGVYYKALEQDIG